jgi:steroid delta-isomerase-like uncharacterized protein
MVVSNKLLIYRWFEEVWNKKRESAIDEMLHPQALVHGLGDPGMVLKGPEAFKPFYRAFVSAIPDLQVAVESTLAEDDKVVARCSARGTHTGAGLGVPPTGKKVIMAGIVLVHVRDGKLYEGWNNWDFLSLYQQVGLLPPLQIKA